MKKKGSHVGIALSFGIFIIFLVFLLGALSPLIKTQKNKQLILDDLKNKLINLSTEEIMTFTLHIEGINPNKDCIKIQNILNDLQELTDPELLLIKDESENTLEYSIEGQALVVKVGTGFSGFLKIYSSDETESSIGDGGSGCEPVTQYDFGSIKQYEYNSDDGVVENLDRYVTDYDSLREELGIPEGTDFGFSFTYSNGTTIGTADESVSTSVYSDQKYVIYMDSEGRLNIGYLTVRVW